MPIAKARVRAPAGRSKATGRRAAKVAVASASARAKLGATLKRAGVGKRPVKGGGAAKGRVSAAPVKAASKLKYGGVGALAGKRGKNEVNSAKRAVPGIAEKSGGKVATKAADKGAGGGAAKASAQEPRTVVGMPRTPAVVKPSAAKARTAVVGPGNVGSDRAGVGLPEGEAPRLAWEAPLPVPHMGSERGGVSVGASARAGEAEPAPGLPVPIASFTI